MAIFGSKTKSNNLYKSKQDEKKQQKHQVFDQAIKADPESYTKPSNPVKEQIKEKLDTNAHFKGLFSQGGLFNSNTANLSMLDMPYIFSDATVDKYLRMYGNNIEGAVEVSVIY